MDWGAYCGGGPPIERNHGSPPMKCVDVSFFWTCVAGIVIAGSIFAICALRSGADFPNAIFVLAMVAGYGGASALHLVYGTVCLDQLVEVKVFDAKHVELSAPAISHTLSMEGMHRVDIFVLGGFLFLLSCRGLIAFCQHPDRI